MRKHAMIGLAFIAVLAACGQHSSAVPNAGPQLTVTSNEALFANLPARTIGIELPSEGLGTIKDRQFGLVGGFTQTARSQILAFKPSLTVRIMNLSHTIPHTLNVLSTTSFPVSPTLSFKASGGPLQKGYSSGVINPQHFVSVLLSKPGTYFLGCAFHYFNRPSMRDVLRVAVNATPGPQATP